MITYSPFLPYLVLHLLFYMDVYITIHEDLSNHCRINPLVLYLKDGNQFQDNQ